MSFCLCLGNSLDTITCIPSLLTLKNLPITLVCHPEESTNHFQFGSFWKGTSILFWLSRIKRSVSSSESKKAHLFLVRELGEKFSPPPYSLTRNKCTFFDSDEDLPIKLPSLVDLMETTATQILRLGRLSAWLPVFLSPAPIVTA